MADKPTGGNKDYARKPFMNSVDYLTGMLRSTEKHYDNLHKRPWSDDKKPYMGDEYPEMESFWTPYNPPPYNPPPVGPPPYTPPPDIPPYIPWHMVFYCNPTECYRKGGVTEIALNCTYPVVGVEFAHFRPDGIEISTSGQYMIVTAAEGDAADDHFEFNVLMRGLNPDEVIEDGEHYSILISACDCEDVVDLEWDFDNNLSIMYANSDRTIYVLNGEPPFDWSVEGEGFSLAESQTTGRSNRLFLSADACGTGEITITGSCSSVTGNVICSTNGRWVKSGEVWCVCLGGGCCHVSQWTIRKPVHVSYGMPERKHLEWTLDGYADCADPWNPYCTAGGCNPPQSGFESCGEMCAAHATEEPFWCDPVDQCGPSCMYGPYATNPIDVIWWEWGCEP